MVWRKVVLYFKWQVLKTFVQKKVHIQFTMEPKPLWSRIDNQKPLRISIGYNSHVLRDKGIYIIPMMTEGEKIGMKIIKGGQNLPGIGNWSAKNWFRHHWIQFIQQFRFWIYCLFCVCDKNSNYPKKFTSAYFDYPKLR